MLKYKLYIKDIIDAITQIESVKKDKLEYKYAWDIILMRLQVIGESTHKIPSVIKKKYPELEWGKFYFLRNIISHAYTSVLPEEIEDIIKNEIPKLKEVIKKIK